jgi:hypothetical protein
LRRNPSLERRRKKGKRKLSLPLPLPLSLTSGIPRAEVSLAIASTSSTMPCGNEGAEATTSAVLRERHLTTSLADRRGAAAAGDGELEEGEGEGAATRTRMPK